LPAITAKIRIALYASLYESRLVYSGVRKIDRAEAVKRIEAMKTAIEKSGDYAVKKTPATKATERS
jgi:hypothetical protein